jgi:hypothetical protein
MHSPWGTHFDNRRWDRNASQERRGCCDSEGDKSRLEKPWEGMDTVGNCSGRCETRGSERTGAGMVFGDGQVNSKGLHH